MTPFLMPEPEAAQASGIIADYPAYRRWWNVEVLRRDGAREAVPECSDAALKRLMLERR